MLIDPLLVEQEIMTLVTPLADPLPVEPFPENPRRYVVETMDSAIGAVLVGLPDMRKRDSHEGAGTFMFLPQISVLTPGLRQAEQHRDAYSVIMRIVNGTSPTFADGIDEQRLVVSGEPFTSIVLRVRFVRHYDNGIWHFLIQQQLVPKMSRAFNPL